MNRTLLLGNGINIHLGIDSLKACEIRKRFNKNLKIYKPLIEKMFDVNMNKVVEGYSNVAEDESIEKLVTILEESIIKNHKEYLTKNDVIRLEDIIVDIGLTSIFFDVETVINFKRQDVALKLAEYKNIFTLNYYEFWDENNICKYLHGEFDLSMYDNTKKKILISEKWKNIPEYKKIIDEIHKENDIDILYRNNTDVILSSANKSKDELHYVAGLYPSNDIYPSDDLQLNNCKQLYEELDGIEHLDIYGMSPYGDDAIINKIKKVKDVRVYVYNIKRYEKKDAKHDNSLEKWKKVLLTTNCKFLDSDEFVI